MGSRISSLLKNTATVVILIIALLPVSATAQDGDPGIADTIRLSCIHLEAVPGEYDSIAIPIYMFNDEPIGAFSLGFHYDSDFIDFIGWKQGSIIPGSGIHLQTVLNESNQVLLGWITFIPTFRIEAYPSGAQLLATMYFRPLPGLSTGVINVDSAFVPPAGSFVLSKGEGGNLSPQFADCDMAEIIIGSTTSCVGPFPCGDVNHSQQLDISDAVYLINYLFAAGQAPKDGGKGDMDCSHRTDITDAVFMVNYMFADGPDPCMGCYESPVIDSLRVFPEIVEPGKVAVITAYASEPTGALLEYRFNIGDFQHAGLSRGTLWTAPQTEGDYLLNLTVTDRCDSAKTQQVIPVQYVSPVIHSFVADDYIVLPSTTVNLRVSATDPNDDPLTFEYLSTGSSVWGADSLVSWTAPFIRGNYSVAVIVSDGRFNDTAEVQITSEVYPVIQSITLPDTLFAGAPVTIVVEADDPYEGTLLFTFYISSGSIEQDGSNTALWTLPEFEETATITVHAENEYGASSQLITVQIVQRPPVN